MQRSTTLSSLVEHLTRRARGRGLTDSAWAARAGLPKETLSRLRRRDTCDFETLTALAEAVSARLGVVEAPASSDGYVPDTLDREYEERLVDLCALRTLDVEQWARLGPPFFMAGLAVMLASVPEFDRRGLLALAESLHPGMSEPEVFRRWLEASPLRASRFLPLVRARVGHAA